jgi:enolase
VIAADLPRLAHEFGCYTGIYEALELRDKGTAFHGKGVEKALSSIRDVIAPALIGKDVTDQSGIDTFMVQTLDGTKNEWGWSKSKLGANAILAVSLAVCKAGAGSAGVPLWEHIAALASNPTTNVLPVPAFNVINGGSHAGNALAFQEFMLLPVGAATFSEAMQIGSETYHHLKAIIKTKYGQDATNVGDEGGFAPNVGHPDECLELLMTAIEAAGYTGKVGIALDVAAGEFFKDGKYDLDFSLPEDRRDATRNITGEQLAEMYIAMADKYPIVSIEDPFDQDDWESVRPCQALFAGCRGQALFAGVERQTCCSARWTLCQHVLFHCSLPSSRRPSEKRCRSSETTSW